MADAKERTLAADCNIVTNAVVSDAEPAKSTTCYYHNLKTQKTIYLTGVLDAPHFVWSWLSDFTLSETECNASCLGLSPFVQSSHVVY